MIALALLLRFLGRLQQSCRLCLESIGMKESFLKAFVSASYGRDGLGHIQNLPKAEIWIPRFLVVPSSERILVACFVGTGKQIRH